MANDDPWERYGKTATGPAVLPGAFYDRMGASKYDMVTQVCQWAGPKELVDIFSSLDLKGAVIADIGIGNGPLSDAFHRAGVRSIIGVDSAPSMLAYCKARGLADIVHHCDIADDLLPLDDDSTDLTVASGLLSYISSPAGAILDLTRVTKPGGHIAVNFHPERIGQNRVEYLPAASLSGGQGDAVVKVFHHDRNSIECAFELAGATLTKEHTIRQGIQRAHTGASVPLTTLLFQKI